MSHHNTTSRPNSQRQTSDLRILTTEESETLLSGFPVTRLSYEVSIHKNDTQYSVAMRDAKNYACFILPKGRRSIAWATEWKRKRIFVIIDIERATNIHGRSGRSSCTSRRTWPSASSASPRRSRRWPRPCAATARALGKPIGPLARSCSSDRRARERPSSARRSRSTSSTPRTRWCGST